MYIILQSNFGLISYERVQVFLRNYMNSAISFYPILKSHIIGESTTELKLIQASTYRDHELIQASNIQQHSNSLTFIHNSFTSVTLCLLILVKFIDMMFLV